MKNLLLLLLSTVFLLLLLAACGDSGETVEAESDDVNKNSTEEQEGTEENEDVGEEAEGATIHRSWDEGETFETGPIILSIDSVSTGSRDLSEDEAAIMEVDHVEYIQVDISVENTAEEDITFYAGQGVISTNTGEQLETEAWLGGHIDGDMMAGTKASDSFVYVLENSKAEDVESIRMVFSRPYNTDSYDEVGEELDFEIELPE